MGYWLPENGNKSLSKQRDQMMTGPSNDNSNLLQSKEISAPSFIFVSCIIQKEVLTLLESNSEASTWGVHKELQPTPKKSLKTILQLWLDPLGLNKVVFNYTSPEKLCTRRMFPEFGYTLRAVCEDNPGTCCTWDLAKLQGWVYAAACRIRTKDPDFEKT